jgi:hypothetical protein
MSFMKGVTIFIDEKNGNKIVQASINEVIKHPDEFESLINFFIAEHPKNKLSLKQRQQTERKRKL